VDYWDYLGWKDTFAQPQFADRQRLYEHRVCSRCLYPQVIVNGAAQAAGDKAAAIDTLIRQARRAPSRVARYRFSAGGRVAVGRVAAAGGADVWWVSFDPRRRMSRSRPATTAAPLSRTKMSCVSWRAWGVDGQVQDVQGAVVGRTNRAVISKRLAAAHSRGARKSRRGALRAAETKGAA